MARPSVSERLDTHDLYAAGFLVGKGHPVQVVSDGPRHRFLFPPTAADDLVDYFKGGAIEGRAFAQALAGIKAQMHAHGR